ncbi:MAG: 50S ribosomal protein L1 [Verrucomicrobia bacterium]|nr:50S ribosomal protein L1 [Verrucomicrobiota bacterium]
MAKKHGKRYRKALETFDPKRLYPLEEAVETLRKFPKAKFDETVEIAFRLGVDPRHSDQMVRGTVALPHGSGKQIRVVVFAKAGTAADAAKEAGAEYVGFEELIQKVKDGWTDFDVAVATPEAMSEVRKLGRILGPRGLMPNPKVGTVTNDTAKAVQEVKAGRVEFKVDRTGNLHMPMGKASFPAQHLVENARAVIDAVKRAKPQTLRGKYIRSGAISCSMSPSVRLQPKEYE